MHWRELPLRQFRKPMIVKTIKFNCVSVKVKEYVISTLNSPETHLHRLKANRLQYFQMFRKLSEVTTAVFINNNMFFNDTCSCSYPGKVLQERRESFPQPSHFDGLNLLFKNVHLINVHIF